MRPSSTQIIDISAAHQIQYQAYCLGMTSQRLLKIIDTNRLSSKLTKDSSSTCSAKSSQHRNYWQGKRKYNGVCNGNKFSKNHQSPLHFRSKQGGKKKND